MKIEELYKIFKTHPAICTDSRNVSKGCIFFALKGDNFDGNRFAIEAINKGASYAVIDNPAYKSGNKCIVVDDVLDILQKLAYYHRRNLGIPIIAVTGTNGKTTTKELLTAVFEMKYKTVATKGNLNNHIGVPLTLLAMNESTEIGIVEMGANHIGEIDALCTIAGPNFGIITNIGKAHIEGFGSLEGVVKAKTEMYKYIEKYNGCVFYNEDNLTLKKLAENLKCKTISYGTSENNFCKGKIILALPYLTFEVFNPEKTNITENIVIKTNLFGSYNFENALATFCAGIYFDIPIKDIKKAIAEYFPNNNRSQLIHIGNNLLLLDFYNANPSSMEAALNDFSKCDANGLKKILILGEMLELGHESENEHLKIIKLIESLGFKEVYLVGKGFHINNSEKYNFFDNSESLKDYLNANKMENSFILIKGSRGVKMEKISECFQ